MILKGQCHEIFWHFLAPDKQAKMVLLKNLISQRYLRNKKLRAVLVYNTTYPESDSAQANTARSPTPSKLTLHGVLPGTILSLQAFRCLQ